MTYLAIILVLISSFSHAGWNLLARRYRNERIYFRRLLASVAIAGFIPFLASAYVTDAIPLKAWLCVTGSGVFCGTYFFFLARSYESSDFTIAYPIARALPVLLLAAGDALRGSSLSIGAFFGILLVTAGCSLVPLNSLRSIKIKHYWNKGTLLMLLTALGTVGYSMLDNVASEIIPPGPVSALRYTYLFYLFTFLTYSFYPVGIKIHDNSPDGSFYAPILSGIMSFGSYALIVSAYQITEHASYVVAFRQFSIVIGVIIGLLIFKEKGIFVRITGTLMLTAGLILIAAKG